MNAFVGTGGGQKIKTRDVRLADKHFHGPWCEVLMAHPGPHPVLQLESRQLQTCTLLINFTGNHHLSTVKLWAPRRLRIYEQLDEAVTS